MNARLLSKALIELVFILTAAFHPSVNGAVAHAACTPTLLTPQANAELDNGRTDRRDRIIWDFDWSDCQGATAYQLYVTLAGAIPVINSEVAISSFHYECSQCYIDNQNRIKWTWRVRARIDNLWGSWSPVRAFTVEPVDRDQPQLPADTCVGRIPTIVGTQGSDHIVGTEKGDVIDGLGGSDIIDGLGGDDVICGGNGLDTLLGGNGNDVIDGLGEDDVIYGGNGRDILLGGLGNDRLFGGKGHDDLFGEKGNDILFGQQNDDWLHGGVGADVLDGGGGNDFCSGGGGQRRGRCKSLL